MKRLALAILLALVCSSALGVDVVDFGADPTGVKDSAPAINEAIASVSKDMPLNPVGLPYGGEVTLPRGVFRLSSPVKVIRGVHLHGESGSGWYGGTWLKPDGDFTAVQIHRYNTGNKDGAGDWSVIRDLNTIGGKHGVQMFARARLENMLVHSCSHDGIQINTTAAAPDANANNWSVFNVRVEHAGNHGFWTRGQDANAGTAYSLDCSHCKGWGIYDQSFLGNTYIGCHVQDNGLGGYKTADASPAKNVFLGCYSEEGQPPNEWGQGTIVLGGIAPVTPHKSSPAAAVIGSQHGLEVSTNLRFPIWDSQHKLSTTIGGHHVFGFGPPHQTELWSLRYIHPYWSIAHENAKQLLSFSTKDSPEGEGQMIFPNGFHISTGYTGRHFMMDYKQPKDGTGKWGDIRFNAYPTYMSDYVGWVNVQGKWKPWGKIEK